ncbi:MAG: hypothetical protein ACREHV_10020 [Rhizomicrobium sp.]
MTDTVLPRPWPAAPFRAQHRWDRNFFLTIVALIWLGILMGFGPEIAHHFTAHQPPFPLILHIHAFVFVGWLALLTTQVLLIRVRRTDLHRKLGVVVACWAVAVVVVGLATAVIVHRLHFGTAQSDPPFISVQIADMLAFGGLAGAAIVWRKTPSAHKRLILLSTIFISDAGFSRWWFDGLEKLLGHGYWPFAAELYLADFLLVVAIGGYDLLTRRRLHPAFVYGAVWGLGLELIAVWLYFSPAWKPVSLALIGH